MATAIKFNLSQIFALLGAMQNVATAKGSLSLSDIQKSSLKAAYQYVFTHQDELDLSEIPSISVKDFAHFFPQPAEAEYALRFLVVTALFDGEINQARLDTTFEFAKAVGIETGYLLQLKKTLEQDFDWLIYDITRKNLESFGFFPELSTKEEIDNWIFPYRGDKQDPALVKKYEMLGQLPKESFGYHIWQQFKKNNYKFPGDAEGANYQFIMPHDSVHLLSGYDTSPYGEVLVSVFTANMVEKNAIEGHILPVLYSFYLGIKINNLAGSTRIKINPKSFWDAWYRGSQAQVNLFAEGWDMWDVAEVTLEQLCKKYHILPIAS
ncbi:MAG: uncharacterized protein K0S08_392 [Gammaproteobacteria bacterium]|jgi:hypothetical protein|nr:uncharacterized protein [Gammaproteobacteria bacterium]